MSEIISGLSESVKKKLKQLLCDCKKEKFDEMGLSIENAKEKTNNVNIEGFTDPTQASISAIQNQVNALDKDSDTLILNRNRNHSETDYQNNIYDALSRINSFLFILYVILFLLTSIVILKQHIDGIQRDEYKDGIIIVLFMLFPFLAYQIEMLIIYIVQKYLYVAAQYVVGPFQTSYI